MSNSGNIEQNYLSALAYGSEEYSLVKKLFRKGWKHPRKSKLPVHAIFKVVCSEKSLSVYQSYRASVEASLPPDTVRGNEKFLFHGTRRACLVGEDGRNDSFDITRSGSMHRFQRFGAGIYTSACSSKADDYCSNVHPMAGRRVLLVSRVVVGNALEKRKNTKDFTHTPYPYHSLVGEPGEDLNYQETVVYHDEAIHPAYAIVYGNTLAAGSKPPSLISRLLSTPLA